MRVLHVIPSVSMGDGGPSKALASMERALTAKGVDVTIATTAHKSGQSRPPFRSALKSGAIDVSFRRSTEFYKIAPGIVSWLWRNSRSFDLIHIHALFSFTTVVAALISRLRGVPYVVRPLGALTNYGIRERRPLLKQLSIKLIETPILRNAAAVHFTSRLEQNEARSLSIQFRDVVIPLGVDDETKCSTGIEQNEYSSLIGRRRILFLSRLDPKKNVEALIEAFAGSESLRTSAALLIAGSGEASYVTRLKAQVSSLGIGDDRIVWLGHLEGERKASVFAAADLFVLPSFSENFCIAAVEALLAGLPCVLGKGVAIARDVELAGAGMAIEPQARALSRAIESLLSNDDERNAMGARARSFALRQYSPEAMAQQLIRLYETITAENDAGST